MPDAGPFRTLGAEHARLELYLANVLDDKDGLDGVDVKQPASRGVLKCPRYTPCNQFKDAFAYNRVKGVG